MGERARALGAAMGAVLLVASCNTTPPEVSDSSTGEASSGPGSTSTATATTSGPVDTTTETGETGVATGSATSGGSSSGGSSESSGTSGDGGSSDSSGGVSSVGCADGEREALLDEAVYPDIAACSGGFSVPGVGSNTPTCDRNGGDDGPIPDGLTCRIDDLCADGWHVCESQGEVAAMGLGDCNGPAWNSGFYATAQSGEGNNACAPTGTNDVFGCGDEGYSTISGCSPLNRSTSDQCGMIAGPWSCPDRFDELNTLVKTGPDFGGALCCRDAP